MAVRCIMTTSPRGSRKNETDTKYSYAEIAEHLTGVSQRLDKRIKEIEQTEAESWAKAHTRIVGRW